jgi:ferrous iron transport protein A
MQNTKDGQMLDKTATTINLRGLLVGQRARIVSIGAQGELGRRIRDMGLVPGSEIEVVGRAPLKDPVALRLMGFTLTLRNNEADHIGVEILNNATDNTAE